MYELSDLIRILCMCGFALLYVYVIFPFLMWFFCEFGEEDCSKETNPSKQE